MTYIPDALRLLVFERAGGRCEYCLLSEQYTVKRHEVDHIYAEKHDGATQEDNLCLSCLTCNRHKGSDLCSLDVLTGSVVTLFHPRKDRWLDHFEVEDGLVQPRTAPGRVTARLLHINDRERIVERRALAKINRYP